MGVDVLFVAMAGPREHEPNIALGYALRARGLRAAFVARASKTADLIRRAGLDACAVEEVGVSSSGDFEATCEPEARLLGIPIRNLTCRARREAGALRALFDRWDPALVVQNGGSESLRRIAFRQAQTQDVPHVFLRPGPFDGRVRVVHDSEGDDLRLPYEPTPDALVAVDRYIANQASLLASNQPRLDASKARQLVSLIRWQRATADAGPNRWRVRFRLARHVRALIAARVAADRYADTIETGRAFFYPLHSCHDAALTVRAPRFVDQRHIVEHLSRAIPPGALLYVKEHPLAVGRYLWSDLAAMFRLPNVRVLQPRLPTWEIARAVRAVVVVNSNAGFEALCAGASVVTMARPYFAGYGATIDIDDVAAAASALGQAAQRGSDKNQVRHLAARIYDATLPGALINPRAADGRACAKCRRDTHRGEVRRHTNSGHPRHRPRPG